MAKVKDLLIMSAIAATTPLTGTWTLMTTLTGGADAVTADPSTGLVVISAGSGFYRSTDRGATWSSAVTGNTSRTGGLIGTTHTFMGDSTKSIITTTNGSTLTTNTYVTPNVLYDRLTGGPTFGIAGIIGFGQGASVTPPSTITDISTAISTGFSPQAHNGVSMYSTINSRFVLAGGGGTYVTTTNGTTYTKYTGNTAEWRSVTQTSTGRYIVCDTNEIIWYNDNPFGNPTGWTQAANVSAVTAFTWGVGNVMAATNDGTIAILGARQTNATQFLVSADNGLNWNLATALGFSSTFVDEVVYAGSNTFIAIVDNGQVWRGVFA